jgi:hypothetical protein
MPCESMTGTPTSLICRCERVPHLKAWVVNFTDLRGSAYVPDSDADSHSEPLEQVRESLFFYAASVATTTGPLPVKLLTLPWILEAKASTLAGLKGYLTNLAACPDGTPVTADFMISSYHELWNVEHPRFQRTSIRLA